MDGSDYRRCDKCGKTASMTQPRHWTEDRRKELFTLLQLLNTAESLNRRNRFIENVESCIKMATKLSECDLETGRPSFYGFLLDLAAEENRTGEI